MKKPSVGQFPCKTVNYTVINYKFLKKDIKKNLKNVYDHEPHF